MQNKASMYTKRQRYIGPSTTGGDISGTIMCVAAYENNLPAYYAIKLDDGRIAYAPAEVVSQHLDYLSLLSNMPTDD